MPGEYQGPCEREAADAGTRVAASAAGMQRRWERSVQAGARGDGASECDVDA